MYRLWIPSSHLPSSCVSADVRRLRSPHLSLLSVTTLTASLTKAQRTRAGLSWEQEQLADRVLGFKITVRRGGTRQGIGAVDEDI